MLNHDSAHSIKFAPLREQDIPLMIVWLRKPHVLKFWPEQMSDEQIWEKYRKHIQSDWVFPYVIFENDKPAGYIQTYMAWRARDGWWPHETEGAYGIDLLLGDEECLNRGLGTQVLTQFLDLIFREFEAKTVIIDVDPKNPRALNCYKKSGFTPEGEVETPDGRALLMRVERK